MSIRYFFLDLNIIKREIDMKIQATKIQAGQTIKVAKMFTTQDDLNIALKEIEQGWEYAKENKSECEAKLAKGIDGRLWTSGKHILEFKVLEVKEFATYGGYTENGRRIGFNETLLVTDKGRYLIQNRNKVTLAK